jgi:MFS family permease
LALLKKALPYALAQFFVVAFQWTAMLFLPLFFKEQGISETGIGALISVFSLSTLVLVFPLGVLTDRLPPRPMMLAGAVLVAAANLLMPGASGVFELALWTFVAGAGFTLSSIALYSLFFKQVGSEKLGLEVSVFNIGGIMGAGVGAWVCGVLSNYYAVEQVLFPLGAGFALAWALAALFLPPVGGVSFPILEYGRDLKSVKTWVLIAILFVTASHAGFEQAGYTLLQTDVIGLSTKTVGNIFMALTVWMCVITAWTGQRHDREERPLLMIGAALILSGAFMAASGSARGPYDFLVYRVLHTAGDSVFNLLTLVVASIIFSKRRVGGAFAFALTINTASFFLFANLGGVVGDHFGFDRAFHLSGLISVVAGAFLLLSRGRVRKLIGMD